MIKTTGLLVSMACLGIVMVSGGASGPTKSATSKAVPTNKKGKNKTAIEIRNSIPKKFFDAHGRVWYQLVNITIPPTSGLRDLEDIDKPPQLFVVVKRDGVEMGETTVHTGWTVDLPTKAANQFPIGIGTAARYTLEVWDNDLAYLFSADEHIRNITQLKGEVFENLTIYEQGDSVTPKETLLKLTWKRILPPKKYQAKVKKTGK